jgi:hypothetical protein
VVLLEVQQVMRKGYYVRATIGLQLKYGRSAMKANQFHRSIASINYLGYSINIFYEDAVCLPSYATNVNLWGWSVQLRFPRPIGHPRLEKAQNNAQEAEKCRENKRKYCHKHNIPL